MWQDRFFPMLTYLNAIHGLAGKYPIYVEALDMTENRIIRRAITGFTTLRLEHLGSSTWLRALNAGTSCRVCTYMLFDAVKVAALSARW